jgi:photosystem II PsbY protein
MDWRVIIVVAPLLVAAGWALFNVGAIAIRQLQQYTSKNS